MIFNVGRVFVLNDPPTQHRQEGRVHYDEVHGIRRGERHEERAARRRLGDQVLDVRVRHVESQEAEA